MAIFNNLPYFPNENPRVHFDWDSSFLLYFIKGKGRLFFVLAWGNHFAHRSFLFPN